MNTPKSLAPPAGLAPHAGVDAPHRVAERPRSSSWAAGAFAMVAAAQGATGCEAAGDAQVSVPLMVAIGQNEVPIYQDANLTLYESQVAVPFPVRKPTAAELGALKPNVAPYPRSPYLLDSDESVEVNYTITNLDTQSHAVWLLLDPWNEFVRYKPGVTVISNDETEPNLSGMEIAIILNPLERLEGNIQPQDMSNLALKLDTAMKIVGTTFTMQSPFGAGTLVNRDFNVQNVPGPGDPLLATYTPTVVAGLTGFDLGLQSYEPVNVAIEATVTVLDNSGSGKILPPGTTTGLIGAPPTFLKIPGAN